jgi:hypothetical protein
MPMPAAPAAVSKWINELTVPVGRYAITNSEGILKFVIVKENKPGTKWQSFRRVFYQASDNEFFVKDRALKQALLRKILEVGPELASIKYGKELGVCGVCGRTLTDEDSRMRGIGPVCRERMGWM